MGYKPYVKTSTGLIDLLLDASTIIEDTNHRFVTDADKVRWDTRVTSVNAQGGQGSHITATGGPITSSGTITLNIEDGYSIPSDADQEAWDKKQQALDAQTAYTNKGSSVKVPQITTNLWGQVTGITEVDIAFPTVNNGGLTFQESGATLETFTANQANGTTINFVPLSEATIDSWFSEE